MKYLKIIGFIAFMPIAVGIVAASPATAGPFNGSQTHRADARPDIVQVDHRREWRHGRRYRDRGHWRYRDRRWRSRDRRWRYRDRYPVRRHGRRYRGYGHHHSNADAFHWLAFTAITVKLLDVITESQQRAHETAQIRATTAPVGETVSWNQGGAQGAVTVVRDGQSSTGRYCREFQQTLVVGGKTESAYGTACRQPDGSWELMP